MVTEVELHQVQQRIDERSAHIVETLSALSDQNLIALSLLPGWSRLTLACHLRYGALALGHMTDDTLAKRPTSYYPKGRSRQRPGSLEPNEGEAPQDVVRSLASHSARLSRMWSALDGQSWGNEIVEPTDNLDLGRVALSRLPLLRLTEVEVHGSDLGLNLEDWSTTFVNVTLPMRIEWLNVRRTNHRTVDRSLEGAWLLVASDGPTYRVDVTKGIVEAVPAAPQTPARAILEATSRDLLALLLGRPFRQVPRVSGDVAFGAAFSGAFPGP